MKKYWEIFFYEMKLLLLYFIEFSEDDTIISKEYPSNCIIGGPENRLIIKITYDKSICFVNNECIKVWIFNGLGILRPERKRKENIVSDFLLL